MTGEDHGPETTGEQPLLVLGEERRVDERWIRVQRLGNAVRTVAFALVTGVGGAIGMFAGDRPGWVRIAIAMTWVVLATARAIHGQLWPSLAWSRLSYRLDEHGLAIRRGVIWWRTTFVARNRIQHTDVERGPISRHFGLARLEVHTAGTENATISLEGLDARLAEEMRDYLIAGAADDSV